MEKNGFLANQKEMDHVWSVQLDLLFWSKAQRFQLPTSISGLVRFH